MRRWSGAARFKGLYAPCTAPVRRRAAGWYEAGRCTFSAAGTLCRAGPSRVPINTLVHYITSQTICQSSKTAFAARAAGCLRPPPLKRQMGLCPVEGPPAQKSAELFVAGAFPPERRAGAAFAGACFRGAPAGAPAPEKQGGALGLRGGLPRRLKPCLRRKFWQKGTKTPKLAG